MRIADEGFIFGYGLWFAVIIFNVLFCHMGNPVLEFSIDLKINLLIVSNVKFLREALAKVFSNDGTFFVVGTAQNQIETYEKLMLKNTDILLMDASMPGAMDTAIQIRENSPSVRTVVFAVVNEVEDIIDWAEAGVMGFVPSSSSINDVTKLVRDILHGKQQCSEQVASGLMHRIASIGVTNERRQPQRSSLLLTKREREITLLLSDGLSNKEIARMLNIEVATAKSHVHNLMLKINLKRRSQVARWIHDQTI